SVIESGIYALETSYDRVWTGCKQFANGPETILAYNASVNDGEPNGNNANYGERLNLSYSFFFSSRRRHTRSKRDWSSDVCSSDLRCSASACWRRDSPLHRSARSRVRS